jgi:hypothetical protein
MYGIVWDFLHIPLKKIHSNSPMDRTLLANLESSEKSVS